MDAIQLRFFFFKGLCRRPSRRKIFTIFNLRFLSKNYLFPESWFTEFRLLAQKRNHRWNYILSLCSAVILEVVGRRDRSHYPSIQVLDFGAAPPQTLGTRPINEASRDAALQKEEENGAEPLPERPSLLGLAIAHLRKRTKHGFTTGFASYPLPSLSRGQSLRT